MVKYPVLFLLMVLLPSVCFANIEAEEANLQKTYGQDLNRAPYFLRYEFGKEYDKDWSESYYTERRAFLIDYEGKTAEEQKNEKAEALAEANEEKQNLQEKKDEARKLKAQLRAEAMEEKAEKKTEEERQKQFNEALKEQQKELQQMNEALRHGGSGGADGGPAQQPDSDD